MKDQTINPQKKYALGNTYIIALTLIALFSIGSQITIQYFLKGQDTDARIINIAGRQRMLSQKITKHTLLLFQSETPIKFQAQKEFLMNSLKLWQTSHKVLLDGNDELEIPEPTLSQTVQNLFSEMKPFQKKIATAGNSILSIDFKDINQHKNLLRTITDNEANYLKLMNDIVFHFEAESKAKIERLKTIEVILMTLTLLLLALEAIFIFRPITRNIKSFIKEIQIKNKNLSETQRNLQINLEELQTSEEKLLQNQEEIAAQRDFLNSKIKQLDITNKKLESGEQILKKLNQSLTASKDELEQKNNDLIRSNRQISLSINSAKTIQEAILPDEDIFQELVGEYFIINRPKDVVSGDFYWLAKIEGKLILVAADCTGHGVPGAFMTLIGASLLDKIIRLEKLLCPDLILEALHLEVSFALKQSYSENNYGMDISIISLEEQVNQYKLIFAGAKNNLLIWTKNGLKELKGSRKAIGGIQNKNKKFENKEIILEQGDLIYLGSDGLEDQNNIKRKKFGKNRIKEIINKVHDLPLKEQQKRFDLALAKHMQDTNQRDDILWMGIKL